MLMKLFKKATRDSMSTHEMDVMMELFNDIKDGTTVRQKRIILATIINEYTNKKRNSSDQSIDLIKKLLNRSTIADKFGCLEDYLRTSKGKKYRCAGKRLQMIIYAALLAAEDRFDIGEEYNEYILDRINGRYNVFYEFNEDGSSNVVNPPEPRIVL